MLRTDRKGLWLCLAACLLWSLMLSCAAAASESEEQLLQDHLATLYEGNLLPNPDFEEADPSIPNRPLGWEPTYNLSDFNQPIWDNEVALSGTRSIRMSAPIATEVVWQSVKVPVKAETTYRFVGYVRTRISSPKERAFTGLFSSRLSTATGCSFPVRPKPALRWRGPTIGPGWSLPLKRHEIPTPSR